MCAAQRNLGTTAKNPCINVSQVEVSMICEEPKLAIVGVKIEKIP